MIEAFLGIRRARTVPERLLRLGTNPFAALFVFVVLSGLFVLRLHPWMMNWGSTLDEQAMVLPGDTAPSSAYFTRAISINAPPAVVWLWLQAIGQDRAGFLSNDWLENLFGGDIHNVDTLRPDWRQREVGDFVPMSGIEGRQLLGDVTLLRVRIMDPEHVIGDIPGRFVLFKEGEHGTRLLLREPYADPIREGALWVVWDPAHFVMERRLLEGIKERAEGQPMVPPALLVAARVGWVLAGLLVLALFVSQRGWWAWLVLPLVPVFTSLRLTGDWNSALAGFLAVGVTLAGALAFGRRWWATYLLLASSIAYVLILAPDTYTAFGLIFLGLDVLVVVAGLRTAAFIGRSHRPAAPGGRVSASVGFG